MTISPVKWKTRENRRMNKSRRSKKKGEEEQLKDKGG